MLCYLLLLLRVSLPLLTGLLEEPGGPAGVWLGWLRVMRVLGVCGGVCVGCGPPPGPGGALSPFPFWLSEAGEAAGGPVVGWGVVGLLSFCTVLLGACWVLYSGFGSLKLGTSE